MNSIKQTTIFYTLLTMYAIAAIFVAFHFDGFGDEGDGILHFLISKYSVDHHYLLFDHWGKPLFTLFSSPFSQMGYVGIKLFNVLCTILTMIFTFQIAKSFEFRFSWLLVLFMAFAPLYTVLTFSGLTEQLFATLLSAGILLIVKRQYFWAALVISFLPFVRSEGLIFIGIFALFFLLIHRWKYILALTIGHLIYSVLGMFYYSDLLWVITQIPYARLSSVYGHGEWFHMVNQLFYVIGLPIYILLGVGFFMAFIRALKRKLNYAFGILVVLGFLTFLVFHSSFWTLGIFNSMGLKRVFNAVIPLIALMALYGTNGIMAWLDDRAGKWVLSSIVLIVLAFPFSHSPAAWNVDRDFKSQNKAIASDAVAYTLSIRKDNSVMYYYDPLIAYTLNMDPFENKKLQLIDSNKLISSSPSDIVIWDKWFCPVERNLNLETTQNLIQKFTSRQFEKADKSGEYVVLQKISNE